MRKFILSIMLFLEILFLFLVINCGQAPILSDNLTSSAKTNPGPISGFAMAYAGGTKSVLFGGYYNGVFFNDTWEYDDSGHTWTQINPTGGTVPIPRSGHAMAYAGTTKLILFGGNNLNDTWEYDSSSHTWTQYNKTLGTMPGFRTGFAMAYAGGTKLVLFGGYYNGVFFNDTWEYDDSGHTWTQINPTGGTVPIPRSGHAMAYAGTTKLILFGGNNLNDTWEYDSSSHTWTQYNKTLGTMPGFRTGFAMAYSGGNKLILFGGYYNGTYLNDTWEYDDSVAAHTWTQFNTTGTMPPARNGHAMADTSGNKLILFGGNLLDDTWEYDDSAVAHIWIQFNKAVY